MHRINIICYYISSICEEIISLLNSAAPTDNYRDIITTSLNVNKGYINLSGYYLYKPSDDWRDSFVVELLFDDFEDKIKVKFSNFPIESKNYYKASLEDLVLVTTKPLHFHVEGILYSSYYHKILYVDQLTKEQCHWYWSEFSDIPIGLLESSNGDVDEFRRVKFLTFRENLSVYENATLKVLDVAEHKIHEDFTEWFDDLLKFLEINSITCMVLPNREAIKSIREYVADVLLLSQNNHVPLLTRSEWVRRSLNLIKNEFLYSNKEYELKRSIFLLRREYRLSEKEVLDVCAQIFSCKEYEQISKYL